MDYSKVLRTLPVILRVKDIPLQTQLVKNHFTFSFLISWKQFLMDSVTAIGSECKYVDIFIIWQYSGYEVTYFFFISSFIKIFNFISRKSVIINIKFLKNFLQTEYFDIASYGTSPISKSTQNMGGKSICMIFSFTLNVSYFTLHA